MGAGLHQRYTGVSLELNRGSTFEEAAAEIHVGVLYQTSVQMPPTSNGSISFSVSPGQGGD
jgi:hypothetical protein